MTTEIIIVNWNNRKETLQCIAAVEAQIGEIGTARVTVVDNGSTDGSPTAIATNHPRVKLFALESNRGFTGGIAAALAGSTADFVVFLNNDAVPEPGWLAALVGAMREAPEDTISVGGKIVDPSGTAIDFIGGLLTFDGHAFQYGFRHPVGSREEPMPGQEILFACGGNMISRRTRLIEIGGFDNDYFAYLEDVDFGWRSWITGGRVIFEPRAVARHASSTTSNRLGDFERGVLFERNALQTALKNYEHLPESAAAVFYAYLHRLHYYATRRNPGTNELTREFGEMSTTSRGSFSRVRRAMRRLLGVREPLVAIDDPLTAMQFRAFEWIRKNSPRIAEKRLEVQSHRRRSDREIFERFPMHFVPTYPGDHELMSSSLFRMLRPPLPSAERELGDIILT